MEIVLLGVILGFPLVVHLCAVGFAYLDASNYGMDPVKWAAISFFVPLFGFFAYLFEREARTPDPDREEMFVDGPFEIHKSRAEDAPFATNEPETEDAVDSRRRDEEQ